MTPEANQNMDPELLVAATSGGAVAWRRFKKQDSARNMGAR